MVLSLTRIAVLQSLGINLPPDAFYFELADVIIMSVAIGFIFKDMFRIQRVPENYDPLEEIRQGTLNKDNLKFAIMAVAPAVVLHEMAHKFVALLFGIKATFYAAYGWLIFGLALKMIGSPFLFFVPGFVSMPPSGPLTGAIIAFAGPLMHGILWIFSKHALKRQLFDRKYNNVLIISRYVNGFLFVLNMLPIPGVDGWHVYTGLWEYLF